MSLNVIELMDSVIADAQALLGELGQDEKARQKIASLLTQAQAIHAELMKYAAADGSIDNVPRSSGYYTRTPFGIFKTSMYIMNKYSEHKTISISTEQMVRLQRMETNVNAVADRLTEIWTDQPNDSST